MNTTIHAEKRRLVDYRQFRFSKLNTPEFEHLKYLLFWPVYGLLLLTVERLSTAPWTTPSPFARSF